MAERGPSRHNRKSDQSTVGFPGAAFERESNLAQLTRWHRSGFSLGVLEDMLKFLGVPAGARTDSGPQGLEPSGLELKITR